MKKANFQNIIAISMLMTISNSQLWAKDIALELPNNKKPIQRNFLNLGFELDSPNLSLRNTNQYGCTYENGGWTRSYCVFNQDVFKTGAYTGWKTTAGTEGSNSSKPGREIELWKEGGTGDNVGVKAPQGFIYAELNAHTPAALYQNVCISKADTLSWSLLHRARQIPNGTLLEKYQKIQFFIGDEISEEADKALSKNSIQVKGKKYLTNQNGETEFSSSNALWTKHYSTKPVKLDSFLNGKSAAIRSFGFEAVSFYDNNNKLLNTPDRGNFLDDIQLTLNPAIEFSAQSGTVSENAEDKTHGVDFNILGVVTNDIQVHFIIDPKKLVGNEKLATLRNAENPNGDYKLYDISGGNEVEIIPTADKDGVLRFSYTIRYDNTLKDQYPKGVTVKGLAIKVFNNKEPDGDRIIPFELDPDQQDLAVLDLRECGETAFSGFKYEILDDEVDLEVKKALLEKTPLPGQKVTYDIELFNHKDAVAQNVILKDEILANLNKDEAKLECIDFTNKAEGETCLAPLNNLDVASLFSKDGVKIGTIKGNTRYKFRVSNLTLNAQDSGQGDYAGIFANKITVSTSSNDIEPKNNEAIAENIYPAESDLVNGHAAGTGEGLFVIDKDGKALWEQTAQDDKAYFPLKIQNTAKLKQDYQLYASSSAIQPTMAEQKLSSLKKESIGSYTDQIKIEFFELSNGQCNSNIPSAKQITQLEVKAESIGEVCAVITIYPSAKDKYDIWFAIESIQTGLGDIIRDAVTSVPFVQRLLELLNDQKAQVNVGGSFVFLHRLLNHGTDDEKDISLQLVPVNGDDGFLYSLFVDKNNDGQLDAKDEMVTSLDQKYSLGKAEVLQLLVKVQSPATATNGMMSQIKLEAIPSNENQSIFLESLINTDTVFVGSDQVQVTKTQFKRENCTAMSADEIEKAKYTVSSQTIGANDCLIYKISIKNTGSEVLKNIDVNDMYPAYTHKWELGQNILPMTSSGEVVEVKGDQVKTTILELLPQQEKSLYFGIKLN